MKILIIIVLTFIATTFSACGLLNEKNESALASTSSTLYAFYETEQSGAIGCYPGMGGNTNANDNSVVGYNPVNTLRSVYSFWIERPTTLVVCVKVTTTYDPNDPVSTQHFTTMISNLASHTLSFYASSAKVSPGSFDLVDYPRIPLLGAVATVYVLGTGTQCPSDPDPITKLVGKFDMYNLTDSQYIVAADDMCGMSVGTGTSPFALAKKFGVTY